MKMTTLFLSILLLITACQKSKDEKPPVGKQGDYRTFTSLSDFSSLLDSLVSLSDSAERETRIKTLWDSLKANHQIPFVFDDSVLFLYKSSVQTADWAGDFNGWNPSTPGWTGERIGDSQIFRLKKKFPKDARLDYKIVANTNWILDPANSFQQYSGFGPNSELRMPDWVFPKETILAEGVVKGSLSANQILSSSSENLGYQVQYKVYLPYNYAEKEDLPVIYITDGHEYADNRLGATLIILDNLIYQQKIEPVIAVFIDPRNPANLSQNRRMDEYRANIRFANFVADELSVAIDAAYKTNVNHDKRAILGTSLGGWNAAFFGLMRSDKFQLIGIHSPAFDQAILQQFNASEKLPLKIFMSTGVIYDTQIQARAMRDILQSNDYPLQYIEVNEGHSWGNWRALTEEPLVWFFGM